MKRIEFTAFPSDGFLRLKHPMQILISRAAPVQNMMKKILRVLNVYNSEVNKERNLIGPQRYWISNKIKEGFS
jgi:hypothetical protein